MIVMNNAIIIVSDDGQEQCHFNHHQSWSWTMSLSTMVMNNNNKISTNPDPEQCNLDYRSTICQVSIFLEKSEQVVQPSTVVTTISNTGTYSAHISTDEVRMNLVPRPVSPHPTVRSDVL